MRAAPRASQVAPALVLLGRAAHAEQPKPDPLLKAPAAQGGQLAQARILIPLAVLAAAHAEPAELVHDQREPAVQQFAAPEEQQKKRLSKLNLFPDYSFIQSRINNEFGIVFSLRIQIV